MFLINIKKKDHYRHVLGKGDKKAFMLKPQKIRIVGHAGHLAEMRFGIADCIFSLPLLIKKIK